MKLPINTHPLLYVRDAEAYIFAMMTAGGLKALPFLLSRFISVAAYSGTEAAAVGYNNNYVDYFFWRSGRLRLETVQIPNDVVYDGLLIEVIKSLLDAGEYVIGIWNEQYIWCKKSYMNKYTAEHFLLYGYDDETRQFYSFGWKGSELAEFTVAYDIIGKALPLKNPPMHLLWGVSAADTDYSFDIANAVSELREFINASGSNHDSCAFGYKAIEYLAFDVQTRQRVNGCIADRELLFLHEYAALMRIRIEYLLRSGVISDSALLSQALAVEKEAHIITCISGPNEFDKISQAINLLAQSLKNIAESLLAALEDNYAAAV